MKGNDWLIFTFLGIVVVLVGYVWLLVANNATVWYKIMIGIGILLIIVGTAGVLHTLSYQKAMISVKKAL